MQTGVITTGGDVAITAQQFSECLKNENGFLGQTIHNICDSTISYVPYGFWDMFEYLGIGLVSIGALFMFYKMFTY